MAECRILSYGCSSAAGPSVRDFWRGLESGLDHARPIEGYPSKFCAWNEPAASPEQEVSDQEVLVRHGLLAWQDCLRGLSGAEKNEIRSSRRLGVILASTKGCIEDEVWKENPDLACDPLTPVLEGFIRQADLAVSDSICVSNACASSLTALFLGRQWLAQGRVAHVIVLAADRPGRFVRKGFETLKILSRAGCRPFDQDRDGLVLGDAAAVIILSKTGGISLDSVATETEGFAVTRPEQSGESLRRACLALPGLAKNPPDLVVAHGTGTAVNDAIEDRVLQALFADRVPVTATKWSIGHTLGASAAMDVIAACEVLRRQEAFRIHSTTQKDRRFGSRFLTQDSELLVPFKAERILVTSLGFGGVHAAALLRKIPEQTGVGGS